MNPGAAIRSLLSRGGSRGASDAGFTLIEVMIGALMAIIVVGASASLFTKANDSSLASQRQSQLLAVADQQIEQIRQQVKTAGFSSLAMNAPPSAGTNSTLTYSAATHTDPNDLVSSAVGCGTSNLGYTIEVNYDDTTAGTTAAAPPSSGCPAGTEPLVVQTGTGIVTPSLPVSVGSGTATVNTYVTETYVGCNTSLGNGSCSQDARRVIVAVRFTDASGRYNIGPNSPVYVSTLFTNPVPTNQPNASIGITLGLGIG